MSIAEAWQPLAGVRVVDFSPFVPGPFAATIFADLGAEVLVELGFDDAEIVQLVRCGAVKAH